MRRVLLMLMVSVLQVYCSLSCPASCVLCSEDAIICSKLYRIIEVSASVKMLMLTDGLIDTVDSILMFNSTMSNMSVLVLSNNVISTIMGNAFQNLTLLRTLLLDYNSITSQSLDRSSFSWLLKLETLHLGHNSLRDIDGSWFQNTKALKTLLLDGNLLTSLNSSTFVSSDLRNLETLDLSNNLISHVSRDSFHKIPQLRSLDLSRNRLQNVPDAFSYLSSLSTLNLDLNFWNCTCAMRELTSFLNTYIRSPGKVLYNGQKMMCTSSDNPAVQSVLQLTDTNCVQASSSNISVKFNKGSVTTQHYIRDVALTAACSFLGGVGITLGAIAVVYWKLGKRLGQRKDGAEEQSIPASAQWDFSEGKDTLSMAYNSNFRGHQIVEKDSVSYERTPGSADNHFICHNCSSATTGTGYQDSGGGRENFLHRANHIAFRHNREDDWSAHMENYRWRNAESNSTLQSRIKDLRAQRHDDKETGGTNIHNLQSQENVPKQWVSKDMSTMRMHQLSLRRQISVPQRQAFTPDGQAHQKMATHGNHTNNHSVLKQQQEEYGRLPILQTINCLHCHQTYEYRQAGAENQDILFRNHKEGTQPREEKISEAIMYKDSLNYNQSNVDQQGENQGRGQRSVTFDLSRSTDNTSIIPNKGHEALYRINKIKMHNTLEENDNPRPGKAYAKIHRNSSHKHLKSHKPRSHQNRTLKVKLNLNPLRRSRVYPKSSAGHEDIDAERTSIKAKKDKLRKSKAKKDNDSHSKQKSKKDKTCKKSPRAESKMIVETESSKEEEEETATTEQENKHTSSSKSKQLKKKDEGSNSNPGDTNDNRKENPNDQHETTQTGSNLPDEGKIQDNNEFLRPINSLQNLSLQNSAPLHGSDSFVQSTDTAAAEPLSILNIPDPHQDANLSAGILGPSTGPQEDSFGPQDKEDLANSTTPTSAASFVVQEYLPSGDGSPKRRIRLIIPEKTSNRPQTSLDRKIR